MNIRLPARWLASAVVLGLLFFASTALYAQEDERESAEISEAQQTLNDEGVRAMIEGDFAGAVALLERSIRMGENNVTYLNLGRAYQKLGNCSEAREALVMAKTAPAVKDPPESEVTSLADEFLSELHEQCDFEEAPAQETDAEPETVDASEGEAQIKEPVEPTPEPASSSKATFGWGTAGLGVAMIGTGVALHFVAEGKRNEVRDAIEDTDGRVTSPTQEEAFALRDQANNLDTAALGLVVGGGVVSAIGTYWIIAGSGAESRSAKLSFSPRRGGLSVTLGGRF